MVSAWVLTLLAICGVAVGLFMGQWRAVSSHLAAAGGGLLFGIALFWLIPEIALTAGWMRALLLVLLATVALGLLDKYLTHSGHSPRQGVIGPLLAATAIHCFLDGWSVRAVSAGPITQVAVPLGLALHKIPEGLGLGWITQVSLASRWRAAGAGIAVESMTLIGAFVEPEADRFGGSEFGAWWTAIVLAVIAGSFVFLGLHAVLPSRKNAGVLAVFFVSLLIAGGIALL